MNRRWLFLLLFSPTLLFLFVLHNVPLLAQNESPLLKLSPPDTEEFPDISFNLFALNSDVSVITDLRGLILTEDGISVTEFLSETLKVGAEVIFVIDANTDIEERDEDGGPSRREIVRDSIHRFVDLYMDPSGLDRVSIIVPDERSGRFLDEPGIEFHNAIRNAINFYLPAELGDTPLNNMMEMALSQAETGSHEGRVPAIILFSDSEQLNEQLEFDSLLQSSARSQAVIYTAILGIRADTWEVDDVERLTVPTGGAYVHMPKVEDADPLYNLIRDRATTSQISYRSSLSSSGQHNLVAELNGGRGEVLFDLLIAPPAARITVDNSVAIRRVASDPETLLEDVEPKIQPLVAEISWPDEHPRELVSVSLLVNGAPHRLGNPVMDDSGLLTFDWDISQFGNGVYAVQIQVEDELGLAGVSEPVPLTIELEQVVLPPTTTPAPTATAIQTPVPVPTSTPAPPGLYDLARDNLGYIGAGALIVAGVVIIFVVVAAIISAFRKDPGSQSLSGSGGITSDSTQDEELASRPTYAMMPGFAMSELGGAYLEAIENAPEHATLIPISASNIALGRDPKVTQITFNDRSVSKLHARILESHGSYRIYDEGSTSGTYVNYQRIGLAPEVLSNKDEIHLGRVHIRFHLTSGPPEQGVEQTVNLEMQDKDTLVKPGDSGLPES